MFHIKHQQILKQYQFYLKQKIIFFILYCNKITKIKIRFYSIFDQINAARVNIRDFFQKHKKS